MGATGRYRERANPRQSVHIKARIVCPDLSRCVDCTVLDVSEGGALASVRTQVTVPDRIYLWQPVSQTMIECEVRWRKLNLLGLKFLQDRGRDRLLAVAVGRSL